MSNSYGLGPTRAWETDAVTGGKETTARRSRCGDDKNTVLGVLGGRQGSAPDSPVGEGFLRWAGHVGEPSGRKEHREPGRRRLTGPRSSLTRWSHMGLRTPALRSQELTRRS